MIPSTFVYNTDPYKFRAAWNNAHKDTPKEQETYFELIIDWANHQYNYDSIAETIEEITPHAYLSDVSWALEPCVVVSRKVEYKIPELVKAMKRLGYKPRFPNQ